MAVRGKGPGPHVMVFGITNTLFFLHKLGLSRGEREGWASLRSRVDGRPGDGRCEGVELLQQRPLWNNSQYEWIYTHNTSTHKKIYIYKYTTYIYLDTDIKKTYTYNHTQSCMAVTLRLVCERTLTLHLLTNIFINTKNIYSTEKG